MRWCGGDGGALHEPITEPILIPLGLGAGDGNRTRVASLGSWNSAIELHLHFLTTFIIITAVLKFVNSIFKFF